MTIRLLFVARAELDEAVEWYEAQARGLGDAFLAEALQSFRLIERHPHAWNPLTDGIRRCRLARFPYGVIYAPQGSDILVFSNTGTSNPFTAGAARLRLRPVAPHSRNGSTDGWDSTFDWMKEGAQVTGVQTEGDRTDGCGRERERSFA